MENNLPKRLQPGIEYLKGKGLNLFAILNVSRLPKRLTSALTDSTLAVSGEIRIILMGNGGQALWRSIPSAQWQQADPIDQYSRDTALEFAGRALAEDDYRVIYPGDTPLSLQQLGSIAGWHTPSPLGIGMHPKWGLWYAYRAVLLTNDPLPEIVSPASPSPCETCSGKPCLSICPAKALSATSAIDMTACAGHRLTPRSSCADRCLARLGCPVATEQRYTLDQIQYHYRLSLETLRHCFS